MYKSPPADGARPSVWPSERPVAGAGVDPGVPGAAARVGRDQFVLVAVYRPVARLPGDDAPHTVSVRDEQHASGAGPDVQVAAELRGGRRPSISG